MKKVARSLSVKAVLSVVSLLAVVGLLPGCAVVGPLLSLGGMAGLAPLQYASLAYTVGEYSYEYAANDKTPDMVIEDKFNAVVTGEAFTLPESMRSEPAGPEQVMVADADKLEDPALSAEARQKRIENLLGERRVQFERLELRRMAFLEAQKERNLTLRQTAMARPMDLSESSVDKVSLD